MRTASSASARLGLTRSAPAAAASTSRPPVTSTATGAASVVGERDQRGVRTGIDAGRDAAAHGHPRAADDALFHRRQDASPGATVERRAGLVDHGGPAAVLEHDGGPADLAVDRHRIDVEAFGEEQLAGDRAEAPRERPDQASGVDHRAGGPTDVHRLATRGDPGVEGAEHLSGRQRGQPDGAVDRLVEADDQHRREPPLAGTDVPTTSDDLV